MKTIKSFFILLLTITFFNCSNDSSDIELQQFKENTLSSRLTVNSSTNKVSNLFFNVGISKIEVLNEGSIRIFKASNIVNKKSSSRKLLINGVDINLKDYELHLKNGFLYLKDNENLKITIKNEKPYIISENFTGFLEDKNALLQSRQVIVLLIFMNELTIPSKYKVIYENELAYNNNISRRPCSFWNTYYSYGVGLSESASEANFQFNNQNDLNGGDLIGCVSLGESEHTSLGVVHYHIQAYCCP